MEERRKRVRRASDRALIDRLKGKSDEEAQEFFKRQRRRAIRHQCIARLTVDVVTKSGNSGEWKGHSDSVKARVLDLSESGASVFAGVPLGMGQRTQIQIYLPDSSRITCNAEVRWTKEKEAKGGYAAGLRFLEPPPDEQAKIRRFLDELDRTLGL